MHTQVPAHSKGGVWSSPREYNGDASWTELPPLIQLGGRDSLISLRGKPVMFA